MSHSVKHLLLFLALTSFTIQSQSKTVSSSNIKFDVGVGGPSIYYPLGWVVQIADRRLATHNSIKEMDLYSFELKTSPTYSFRVAYPFNQRLYVVSSIGFSTLFIDYYNPYSHQKKSHENTYTYDVIIGGRYVFSRKVDYYIQVLLGVAQQGEAEYWERYAQIKKGGRILNLPTWLGYQIGFGFTFDLGRTFYGICDWGVGTENYVFPMGGRLGVGIKL